MGILSELQPKPDLAVLSVAGQPCYNGGGYSGTATDFILDSLQRLNYPKQVRRRATCGLNTSAGLSLLFPALPQVTWALHDRGPIPPFEIDLKPLETAVRKDTTCEILTLQHAKPHVILRSPV